MNKLLILGGHGDGEVVAATLKILNKEGRIEPIGFLNDHEKLGSLISGLPILDSIDKGGAG